MQTDTTSSTITGDPMLELLERREAVDSTYERGGLSEQETGAAIEKSYALLQQAAELAPTSLAGALAALTAVAGDLRLHGFGPDDSHAMLVEGVLAYLERPAPVDPHAKWAARAAGLEQMYDNPPAHLEEGSAEMAAIYDKWRDLQCRISLTPAATVRGAIEQIRLVIETSDNQSIPNETNIQGLRNAVATLERLAA